MVRGIELATFCTQACLSPSSSVKLEYSQIKHVFNSCAGCVVLSHDKKLEILGDMFGDNV